MDGSKCKKWNYSFQWTDKHMSQEEMKPLRYQYDELAAKSLEKLQQIAAESKTKTDPQAAPERLDFHTLLRENHSKDETLQKFWDELHTVPEWVDWEQLARGQEFFYRYAAANLTGFAFQGFVGENSAASGVVEVLVRTGGFSSKVILRRLLETFQWLLQVTRDLPSIQPGGEGHAATIRSRPGYFNVEKYGVPANTLDSIHSITTFSCNPMWFQLPRMGIVPTQQEKDDYIALFRYIAYLLGTPTDYFVTSEKAKAVMESMFYHELEVTPTSKVVGYNFVSCIENLPAIDIPKDFIEATSRWFNGDELCDALDLGRPAWTHYLAMVSLSCTVTMLAFFQRTFPSFDRFMVKYFRDALFNAIVMSKAGLNGRTSFDFKYVPQDGKQTGREGQKSDKVEKQEKWAVEKCLLVTFAIELAIVSVILALCVKGGSALFGLFQRHSGFGGTRWSHLDGLTHVVS